MADPKPYQNAEAVINQAKSLKGKTLREIIPAGYKLNKRNKGAVGNLIESYGFGIPNNSLAEPDFFEAGIELKVLPLVRKKNGFGIKERTKVCAINYQTLPDETWENSHARAKLEKVLFVFYHYNENALDSKVLDCELFELGSDEDVLEKDWWNVVECVRAGRAHELSESMSHYLAASRSGSGGTDKYGNARDLTYQYQKQEPKALRRAFSLKPSFTTQIYQEFTKKKKFSSLEGVNFDLGLAGIVDFALHKLWAFQGMTLVEFAVATGLKLNKGKANAAQLIRTALGLKGSHKNVREFARLGLSFKVVPVHTESKKPFEAMSFPYTRFLDIVHYDFMDVGLLDDLSNLIIIPLERTNRKDRGEGERIGKAFFWTPDNTEIDLIEKEYNEYQKVLAKVSAEILENANIRKAQEIWLRDWIQASDTQIVHMRPHARDSNDLDPSLPELGVCKYSFWLNQTFLQRIVNNA